MVILIVPFLGYFFLFSVVGLMSFFSLGMAPLLASYYLRGPKRHINILIEREHQLKSEESNNHNYLAFYSKSGYLSFNFDITTKIIREISLGKEEKILGIFQIERKLILSSYLILTNHHLIHYFPSFIADYRDKSLYLPIKQIASYNFNKKGRKVILNVESVDGRTLLFRGLDRKVLEPLQNLIDL